MLDLTTGWIIKLVRWKQSGSYLRLCAMTYTRLHTSGLHSFTQIFLLLEFCGGGVPLKLLPFPLDETAKGGFTFHWISTVIVLFPYSHLWHTIISLLIHKSQNYGDFKQYCLFFRQRRVKCREIKTLATARKWQKSGHKSRESLFYCCRPLWWKKYILLILQH